MSSSNYELTDIKKDSKINPKAAATGISDGSEQPQVVVVGRDTGTQMLAADGSNSPLDKYQLVFSILLLHGIGTLMPWNMFITAETYFRDYKLASLTDNATITSTNETNFVPEDVSDIRKNFLTYVGLASQLPNVLFNGLNLLINMGSGNLKLRVNGALVLEAIVFIFTIILATVDSSTWQTLFFHLTIISIVVLNMASGVYQNCVYGTAAIFPGSYTNAILIGSNASGTFISIVDLLSKWIAPEPQVAAIYYFVTALIVILLCIISYNLLPYNLFYRYFDRQAKIGVTSTPDAVPANKISKIRNNNLDDSEAQLDLSSHSLDQQDEVPATLRETVDAMVPRLKDADTTNEVSSFKEGLKKKWAVFKKCWPQCLSVFFTFYITLALFPAVLVNIEQSQDFFSNKYFLSVACFLTFNVFALIGNIISGWTTWPGKNHVGKFVFVRILFVPFFLFCKLNPKTRHWPILIKSDIIYMIGNSLLALTSGYLSSLCMMFASSDLSADEAPTAGMLAAFFLVFGIFMGINSSFVLTTIVELG